MLEYVSEGGSGGGDRTPILKFSAKDGSFIAVERVQIDGQWTNQENELTPPFKVAMDLAELEVGWIGYRPAPDFRMAKVGEPRPEKPDEVDDEGRHIHKWGFRVRLCNQEIGLRELSSSSRNVYERLSDLHTEWKAGKDANVGKVPIVQISGTDRVQQAPPRASVGNVKPQTWRVPTWSIVGWTERPATLDGVQETAAAPIAPPTTTVSPTTPAGADLF